MRTIYEDTPHSDESDQHPVDVIGEFALQACRSWESGELTDSQTINKAKKIVGDLHSYALSHGIVPPEAVILELTEGAEDAVRDLLDAGIQADVDSKKGLHPDTLKRMQRVLDYTVDQHPVTAAPEAVAQENLVMSFREVIDNVSFADGVIDYRRAVHRAHDEVGESYPS